MSRVRNADEFLLLLRKINDDYASKFGRQIEAARREYSAIAARLPLPPVDEALEIHARVYIVNALLSALNWRLDVHPEDGLPNLLPEIPVRSAQKRTVRFMDYLGLERNTAAPLLIVETKRPQDSLPQSRDAATYPELLVLGMRGTALSGEWNAWLNTVRDYVQSVHRQVQKVPRRVVITNGKWLVLFLNPTDAFIAGASDAAQILVFSDEHELETRFAELFQHLEYYNVRGQLPVVAPAELPFLGDASLVEQAMHGLRLRYLDLKRTYDRAPKIMVAPIVFLRSRFGAWFRVESPPQYHELPYGEDELSEHLDQVKQAAEALLEDITRRLGRAIVVVSLMEYYADGESFAGLPGVAEVIEDEDLFLVATGSQTHYLMREPSVPDCPYHDWVKAHNARVPAGPSPIMVPSTDPRSFFSSGQLHHCAHKDVLLAKSSQITAANREHCGPRSGQDGEAFCEIFQFERHLCCRTCVFETVCTKARAFQLPCVRPAAPVAATVNIA